MSGLLADFFHRIGLYTVSDNSELSFVFISFRGRNKLLYKALFRDGIEKL